MSSTRGDIPDVIIDHVSPESEVEIGHIRGPLVECSAVDTFNLQEDAAAADGIAVAMAPEVEADGIEVDTFNLQEDAAAPDRIAVAMAADLEEDLIDWNDSSPSFLFKVPANQRRENPEAFEPHLFFFGPYQYAAMASNSALAAASLDGEHLKQQVAQAVLEEGQLQKLALKIKRHYSEIKEMYPQMTSEQWGTIGMEQLAERMALDAVTVAATWFIFSWTIRTSFGVGRQGRYDRNITAFSWPIVEMLARDASLLENQIPLNVLRYAFKSLKIPSSFQIMVIHAYCRMGVYFPDHEPRWPNRRKASDCLLGAMYDSLTPSQDDEDPQEQLDQFNAMDSDHHSRLLTVSHLAQCGIRCQVLNQRPKSTPWHGRRFSCIFNFTEKDKVPKLRACDGTFMGSIKFDERKGVIELPRIKVGDDTVRFLHNLLAYEASCRCPKERFVVSYCDFMDHLIDTEEDVHILVKAGVIQNALGSHGELAATWNKLCKSVILMSTPKDYKIILQVDALAKARWRRWRAEFMETYWEKKPWLIVSIVAAAVLLVSTILQTIFTIKNG